ncbi:toll/interleukin-1 receptor domain-containing protein [Reyranella sp.]|uniref:toll/interleukin-1 receptor domain-containing protein n=1 Tax=Reyranella sp. TaxID=1929291 RepID=UPI00121A4A5D|nr:toll/interleukin-1 receptor domain-containing protein [Reyranella sp.]TAJ82090.1 MAG: toll/interleukin-1 receptor domain-containing protein [Reyranella sp.]
MPVTVFISYSHADAAVLERLHKHLAMLRRDSIIKAWTDHEILPGDRFDAVIKSSLENSALFLALVSPDYLASNYCYEKEFQHALTLMKAGRLRIVPIIVEPCDWQNSPFGQFMALPKDGKPVSDWTNANTAYLDVVGGLRRFLTAPAPSLTTEIRTAPGNAAPRRVRVKQDFDSIQKAEFTDRAYEIIRNYFESSCKELTEVGEGTLKAKFEAMNATTFTCTVINRAKKSAEAHITIRNSKGGGGFFGDINYVYERHAPGNISNGHVGVEADDYSLYLTLANFSSGRSREDKYSAEQVADRLWSDLVSRAGIEYE